jgi:hypothetical protein
VYSVYDMSMPSLADVRNVDSNNVDIQSAERTATWVAAGLVTGVALITSDATVFVIGGAAIVAFAWMFRHADQVNPLSGRALAPALQLVPGGISDAPIPEDQVFVAD